MKIIPNLTDSCSDKNSLSSILKRIENKIYCLSKIECNNICFGLDNKLDYSNLEDLFTYKDIIISKFKGCNCYEQYPLSLIISKINKLIQ